ncbi:hypothetical protein PFISCL1PPCAC_28614, partial [Pristionchus fissidentatus]
VIVVSLLAIIAFALAKPLDRKNFQERFDSCFELGLTYATDKNSLSALEYLSLFKCKTNFEQFINEKYGMNYRAVMKTMLKNMPVLKEAIT